MFNKFSLKKMQNQLLERIKWNLKFNTLFIKPICFVLIISILTGCASIYRPLNPARENLTFSQSNDCLTYSYKYDMLAIANNRKYDRKARARGIQLVIAEITNNTSQPISFRDNLLMYMGNQQLTPIEPLLVYKKVHQTIPGYLAYLLLWITIYDENGKGPVIPIGLPIFLFNTALALSANSAFRTELVNNDLTSVQIAPGQTRRGILCFYSEFSGSLVFAVRGENCYSAVEEDATKKKILESGGYSIIQPTVNNNYGTISPQNYLGDGSELYEKLIQYSPEDTSLIQYKDRVLATLKRDPNFYGIIYKSFTYRNGNIKYHGIKAKHDFGDNPDYLYKIGRWEYFDEDGKMVKIIDYNLFGKVISEVSF